MKICNTFLTITTLTPNPLYHYTDHLHHHRHQIQPFNTSTHPPHQPQWHVKIHSNTHLLWHPPQDLTFHQLFLLLLLFDDYYCATTFNSIPRVILCEAPFIIHIHPPKLVLWWFLTQTISLSLASLRSSFFPSDSCSIKYTHKFIFIIIMIIIGLAIWTGNPESGVSTVGAL